ncbi:MAG: SPOR domain-containing protein [Azoarcus sp.]|nr:SPOR domain-containing protein [Azoarcus sp.]
MNHIRMHRIPSSFAPPSRSRGGTILGIFIGMTLGACIVAVTVWLFNRGDNPFHQQSAVAPPRTSPADDRQPVALPGKPGGPLVEKPNFTFYKVLPGDGGGAPSPGQVHHVGPGVPLPPPVSASAAKTIYLQLGAFESADQADNLKAQLALMGMEPITQRAQLPDGRVVHRIRIGPYASVDDLTPARNRLASNGITGNVVSAEQ